MNNCSFIGRLTRDPELRQTKTGKSVCQFSLAIQRRFNKDQADFLDFNAWEKTGELIAKYFTKGKQIALTASAQQDTWEGDDGKKKSKVTFRVDNITFIGDRSAPKDDDDIDF